MNIAPTDVAAHQQTADAVVVSVAPSGSLSPGVSELDEACDRRISSLIKRGEFSCQQGELCMLHELPGVKSPLVCLLGQGDLLSDQPQRAFQQAATAAKALATRQRDTVAFYLGGSSVDGVCGAMVGSLGQEIRREQPRLYPFHNLLWSEGQPSDLEQGEILGESVNLARQLVNAPASDMTPVGFAETVGPHASAAGLQYEVWDEVRLRREKCQSLLAVARGSTAPPRLMIMEYRGSEIETPQVALVGKGVTFDSGGLSMKSGEGMKTMKCDMAGAATVAATMCAIARLRLPVHVVGLVGLAENMVSGSSFKLGDVLRARSGRTIEVLNTDAEGRLVLADVLDVARDRQPQSIVDVATLTGACVVALGQDVAGLMTNDSQWGQRIKEAASQCGELVWELPMFDFYSDQIRSQVADIKNVGDGRWGGAITAAKFLEEFVGDSTWAHLDIAGPAFSDKSKPWVDAGATGCCVRTLVQLVASVSD